MNMQIENERRLRFFGNTFISIKGHPHREFFQKKLKVLSPIRNMNRLITILIVVLGSS